MELYEAMQKRRTIRDFCQDREVSDEQLERILNTAFLAPSNDHLRQIEFVVVRGREEIQKVIAPVEKNTNTIQAAGLASAEGVMDEDEYQMFSDALPCQNIRSDFCWGQLLKHESAEGRISSSNTELMRQRICIKQVR